jgi:hypothetical protein
MTKRKGLTFIQQFLPTNRDDPANARYLVPLPDADDEDEAYDMADEIYYACVPYFPADITMKEMDRAWEQALIDSRRMICDPEYFRIFEW